MRYSVKFNGIELNQYIDVLQGFTPRVGVDWSPDLLTSGGINRGAEFSYTSYKQKTIKMPFTIFENLQENYDALEDVLNVDEPKALIFEDIPDRVFYAVPSGNLDFDEDGCLGEGTITWIIPDGVAHSLIEKTSANNGESTITLTNSGTETTPINVKAKMLSDNGYLGLVLDDRFYQIGNPGEVDEVTKEKSVKLFDDHFTQDRGWILNSGVTPVVTPERLMVGMVGYTVESTPTGEGFVKATDYGTGDSWHGPALTKIIPADENGEYPTNWRCEYRFDFNTDPGGPTAGKQIGHSSVTFSDENDDIICSVVFEDNNPVMERSDMAVYIENKRVLLGRVLGDTGWSVGKNEIPDRKRATKYDSITDTQLARVGMIMNSFEAECDFEIVLDGSKVVKQVVNIYKTLGEDKTQQRFIDEINLTALRRNESIEDLCTCVRCYGKEVDGKTTTIADIVYDDGRYYSPKGHVRIYDREARNKWSRFRAYNYEGQSEFLGYINGTFKYDTDNAQELFNRGLENLKSRNEKRVAYEASLYDLQADIGDTVQIASTRSGEAIYLSARVLSVTNHYTVNGEDTGVLANYTLLESNPARSISDLLEELKKQIVGVIGSAVAYQLGTSGTEPPTGEWQTTPIEPAAGEYLWTRTITSYSDGSGSESYSVSKNGSDAILLQIDSSNGNIFKNNLISTTLTVTIIVGENRIDSSEKMRRTFGEGAEIHWECRRFGEKEFAAIPYDDPRIGDDGFILTLNPRDIDTKAVFRCNLLF